MFEPNYRIVLDDDYGFPGECGFFQLKCNGFEYGLIYSKEAEEAIGLDWLYGVFV